MYGQIARAIEPHLPLQQAIDDWNRISRGLADPPRQRTPQIDERFPEPSIQTS